MLSMKNHFQPKLSDGFSALTEKWVEMEFGDPKPSKWSRLNVQNKLEKLTGLRYIELGAALREGYGSPVVSLRGEGLAPSGNFECPMSLNQLLYDLTLIPRRGCANPS